MNQVLRLKHLVSALLLILLSLTAKPAYAQEPVIPGDDGRVCDFEDPHTSGEAEVDPDQHMLRAGADSGVGGSDSASADFSVNFIPQVSFPANLTAGFVALGFIEDHFGQESFYRIEMTLFNEDTGAELASIQVASESSPPPATDLIDEGHEGTITANLEAGTEYSVQMRLEVETHRNAEVDFLTGNRGVIVDLINCFQVTPDLDDSDGDSIYDSWETGGIDVDGGSDDLDLQALGVDFRGVPIQLNPMHKDILVEIDYFDCSTAGGDCPAGDTHSHRPDSSALNDIVESFAAAPVSNPDGTNGINLWIVVDEDLPHQDICDLDAACFDVIKDSSFGPPPHLSDDATQAARALVFHYNLWVHSKGNGTWGESDGGCDGGTVPLPGDDFVVSLGTFTPETRTPTQQSYAFMHEFGHNLGLCHGGQDDENCKPNYLSVMSYMFFSPGIPPLGTYDYSRNALPASGALDETDLDETIGIQDGGFQTYYGPPTSGIPNLGQGVGSINWDLDGTIEPSVPADINFLGIYGCSAPSPGDTLTGYEDWGNLIYNFRDSDFFPVGHASGGDNEPNQDQAAEIEAATWWYWSDAYRHEYRAKFVCGLQDDAEVLRLTRGLYGSTINILNPSTQPAEFMKRLLLTFPPAEQRPGDVFTIGLDYLPSNRALKVDCDDVQARLFPDGFPEGYIEGFVTLQSDQQLEVVGVYTLASVDADGQIVGGSSIDVEPIPERRPARTDLPDLTVVDIDMDSLVLDCVRGVCSMGVEFTVANIGTADAGPFNVRAAFDPYQSVIANELSDGLAVGESQTFSASGQGDLCFDPQCTICVLVDVGNPGPIEESNETNNILCETN